MRRIIWLMAFVATLLLSFGASASEWDCHVFGDVLRGSKWLERTLDLDVGIKDKSKAEEYAREQWAAAFAPDPAKRRGVTAECEPSTKRAPTTKTWTCRIASRWMAVFDMGGKPELRRGIALHDEPSVAGDDKGSALTKAVELQRQKLASGILRGGRSIVVVLVAGECWTDTKPSKPNGWPSAIPW